MLVFWISLGLALSLVVGIVITKLTDRTQEHTYNFSVTIWPPGDFSCVLSTSEADAVKGQPITIDIDNTVSGGFDCKIFFAVNGLPADACSFSANPASPGERSVLTIDTNKLDSNTTYTCTLIARADKPATWVEG